MAKRDHLRRLDDAPYRGHAVVHWTMTIRDRRTGWLDAKFYCRFRELLTHSQFRFAIACPILCLMPDHVHLMWMGILDSSDQRLAMRHLRKRCSESLSRIGFELQDQPYDHVLGEDERQEKAFIAQSSQAGAADAGYAVASRLEEFLGEPLFVPMQELGEKRGGWGGVLTAKDGTVVAFQSPGGGHCRRSRDGGFASMEGTGLLTTRPVKFKGKHLFVNLNGDLRVEVLFSMNRRDIYHWKSNDWN